MNNPLAGPRLDVFIDSLIFHLGHIGKHNLPYYNIKRIEQGIKSIKEETHMKDIHFAAAVYLLVINLSAVAVYGWDKLSAKQGWQRIPEKILLLLALLGGSVGAMAAMAIFRHKTLHLKFRYGVPLILVLQIAGIVYLHL